MKLFIIKVFVLFIRILYAPMKLRKTQNKILWLSRQSDNKSSDMIMLERAISDLSPETKQVFRLKRLKDESALSVSYIFSIFGDMWELASAKIVLIDTYSIPVSCLNHKECLKVVQLWHALGAVKKFGLQSAGKAQGRDLGVSKAMHMHENYDFVIAPSVATGEIYCKAFGCKRENVRILSLPRVDLLLDGASRRNDFERENPDSKGKRIVAYIPTFRDNDEVYAEKLYKAFENNVGFKLIVSAHPLSKTTEIGAYKFNGDFSSIDLMKLADVIVTDYSACAIEGSLLGKPLFFYVPDYDIYKDEKGLNIELKEEMPGLAFEYENELISAIESDNYDFNTLYRFSEKYVENKKTNNTERMAEFICSEMR
ncbi:MAG: CDP-glycerol glycerophosphotransferase family protein [Clostridia bacterium]|nr:CDP-glycerol glycerophosphotransferase family protein [Clostridia bacterium]